MKKFMDIFSVGSIFFVYIAMRYYTKAVRLRSTGFLLKCIASLLFALSLILWKYDVFLFPVVIILCIILIEIGDGILTTGERHLMEANLRQPFYRKLLGMLPDKKIQDAVANEEKERVDTKMENEKLPISVGISSIVTGVLIFFWKEDIVFPAVLVTSGIYSIILGKYYSRGKL